MRALESAMACNPHVGLFLTLPNVFEEVVDVATLLPDIVGHHHHRGLLGRPSARVAGGSRKLMCSKLTTSAPESLQVDYLADHCC